MKVEVDVTDEDLVAFWRSFVRVPQNRVPDPRTGIGVPDPKPGIVWFSLTIIVTLGAVVALLHWFSILRFDVPTAMVTVFLTAVFLWAILWRQASRSGIELADGLYLGHHTYVFESDGIRRTSTHTDMFTRWSGVRSIHETTQHIFLMLDRTNAYIFPKRSFDSDKDLREFKSLIEKHKEITELEKTL